MVESQTDGDFVDYAMTVGVLIVVLCLIAPSAIAQQQKRVIGGFENVHPLPAGASTPRTADGHPDLSGVWFPNSAGVQAASFGEFPVDPAARVFKMSPDDKPSFQPDVAAKFRAASAVDVKHGHLSANGSGGCAEGGVPANLLREPTLYPIQLVQTPALLVELTEYTRDYRVIHTDGRPHSPDPDPTLDGDSVAHWEGDTLIVDVISLQNIRPSGARDLFFSFHSDQEHVIERWSRPSVNYLLYQATIEDPKAFTKPWKSGIRRWSLSANHEELEEFRCTNNAEPEEYQKIGADEAKHK